ncbi:unnamed protein product [Chrysoparadoxa australica]
MLALLVSPKSMPGTSLLVPAVRHTSPLPFFPSTSEVESFSGSSPPSLFILSVKLQAAKPLPRMPETTSSTLQAAYAASSNRRWKGAKPVNNAAMPDPEPNQSLGSRHDSSMTGSEQSPGLTSHETSMTSHCSQSSTEEERRSADRKRCISEAIYAHGSLDERCYPLILRAEPLPPERCHHAQQGGTTLQELQGAVLSLVP